MKIIQFNGEAYVHKKTKINWKYIFFKMITAQKLIKLIRKRSL